MPEDFYDLFGVDEDASRDAISNAYRDLVRDYHPDNNDADNAREQFKTIRIAREVLMEEESRERYDTYGHVRYVENFIEQDLDGFEFTATAEYSMTDPGPTPSQSSGDTTTKQEPPSQAGDETIGVEADADPQPEPTGIEDRTIEADETDYEGPDIDENVYEAGDEKIVFKPKVNNSIINMSWLVVSTFAMYLLGIGAFLRDNQTQVAQLIADGPSLQPNRSGLPTLADVTMNAIASPTADPLQTLIPVGLAFLFLSLTLTIIRFGSASTWVYAIGLLPPIGLIAYEFFRPPLSPTIEAIVFVGLPFVITFAFISDILGRVVVQYLRYYWYRYGPT